MTRQDNCYTLSAKFKVSFRSARSYTEGIACVITKKTGYSLYCSINRSATLLLMFSHFLVFFYFVTCRINPFLTGDTSTLSIRQCECVACYTLECSSSSTYCRHHHDPLGVVSMAESILLAKRPWRDIHFS